MFIFLPGISSEALPQEPEQTISEFRLSGFGEGGKRAWEIRGKTADIFSGRIKLNDFAGIIYDQEKISVVADRGDFDRIQDKVHLENNVVITTESGVKLTTDYLEWVRHTSQVYTDATVNIEKGNIVISGVGMQGNVNLENVDLKKDIRLLQIDNKKNRIIVTCLGPLNVNYAQNIALFNRDVFVDDGESQMYADLMEVIFLASESSNSSGTFAGLDGQIKRIVSRGNVKIVRQENTTFSNEAVYNANNKSIILTGKPKLVIPNNGQFYEK